MALDVDCLSKKTVLCTLLNEPYYKMLCICNYCNMQEFVLQGELLESYLCHSFTSYLWIEEIFVNYYVSGNTM